ncbi:MAG: hypothetical protein JWM02_2010 [Frankiales bacterium]|nr:hypothetical protein [Frankiales bacterium]
MTVDPFATATPRRSLGDRFRTVDTAMGAVAAVLLPLGLLVVGLGWYGAAHTPYLFEQVPYLISGGLIGLGLVLTGGLLHFASWIARSAATQQQATEELAGLLREIRDELAARPAAASAPTRTSKARNGSNPFVATAGGSMLHRPDCSVVVGREDLRPVAATGSGLQPCGLCSPLSTTPAGTAPAGTTPARPAPSRRSPART